MPKPIATPDVAVLLPSEVVQALQDLADERKQTIPELLDGMTQKARKEPPVSVPVPDPVGAVRTGRPQDYIRPGYSRRQRPETEAEKRIYFGGDYPSVTVPDEF